ncbi:hypothetical protein ES705_34898 [subsurface metagenome]
MSSPIIRKIVVITLCLTAASAVANDIPIRTTPIFSFANDLAEVSTSISSFSSICAVVFSVEITGVAISYIADFPFGFQVKISGSSTLIACLLSFPVSASASIPVLVFARTLPFVSWIITYTTSSSSSIPAIILSRVSSSPISTPYLLLYAVLFTRDSPLIFNPV